MVVVTTVPRLDVVLHRLEIQDGRGGLVEPSLAMVETKSPSLGPTGLRGRVQGVQSLRPDAVRCRL